MSRSRLLTLSRCAARGTSTAALFLPGTTDHFGTIHNFDVLIGVLLSDLPEPMAGELLLPRQSPLVGGVLSRAAPTAGRRAPEGNDALPTGVETDRLFTRPVHHCIGAAGVTSSLPIT